MNGWRRKNRSWNSNRRRESREMWGQDKNSGNLCVIAEKEVKAYNARI